MDTKLDGIFRDELRRIKLVQVVALDPGFFSTKVAFNKKTALLQTAVARVRELGMATVGMKSAGRHAHIVTVGDDTFAVGEGAWYKGDALNSLEYSSIVSPARMAAFYATLAQIAEPSDFTEPVFLVVGLPVALLEGSEADATIDSLRKLKREHAFTVDGKDYQFTVERIRKFAQPVGAYFNYFYDDDLKMRPGVRGKEVAVLDIGGNTLDVYAIIDNEVMDTFVGGADVGVKLLIESIHKNGHSLVELDYRLRNGTLRPTDAQLTEWIGKIMGNIKTRDERNIDFKRFDVVLPVGGGVMIAGDKLRDALLARGANVHWSDDPVMENVKGFELWGRRNNG